MTYGPRAPRRPSLIEEWCERHGFDASELREAAECVPPVPSKAAPTPRAQRESATWIANLMGHETPEALRDEFRGPM